MKISILHITKCKQILLIFLIFIASTALYCQDKTASSDSTLSDLLKRSEESWHSNIPKAQKLAKEAFSMVSTKTPPELRAEAFTQYGISFYTDLNYDSAIHYYEKATKIAIDNNLEVYKYLATTTTAMEKTGRFMDAIEMLEKESIMLKLMLLNYSIY